MLHQPSLKLPERKRREWSSGSCRSPSPPLDHPAGTGTTTALGQRCVAMPTSPAIVPVWWHVGADRPRAKEVVGGSSEEETGTRQSRRSLHSQGIVKSCLAGWKLEVLPMPRFLPYSEEFTFLHRIRAAPDPLSDLLSCLEIILHIPNLANGSRWNEVMLLVL